MFPARLGSTTALCARHGCTLHAGRGWEGNRLKGGFRTHYPFICLLPRRSNRFSSVCFLGCEHLYRVTALQFRLPSTRMPPGNSLPITVAVRGPWRLNMFVVYCGHRQAIAYPPLQHFLAEVHPLASSRSMFVHHAICNIGFCCQQQTSQQATSYRYGPGPFGELIR